MISVICVGCLCVHAAVGQVLEDLPAAVHSANVAFRIMLVNPWVDGFGAPMLNFDLCIGDPDQHQRYSCRMMPVPYPL